MSKRTEQVSALLQKDINEIIIRDFEPPLGTLVSVSLVTVSPDLKNATVYVSVLPDNRIGTGLAAIRKFSGHVQKAINKKLTLHNVPKLHWELDERAIRYDEFDRALE